MHQAIKSFRPINDLELGRIMQLSFLDTAQDDSRFIQRIKGAHRGLQADIYRLAPEDANVVHYIVAIKGPVRFISVSDILGLKVESEIGKSGSAESMDSTVLTGEFNFSDDEETPFVHRDIAQAGVELNENLEYFFKDMATKCLVGNTIKISLVGHGVGGSIAYYAAPRLAKLKPTIWIDTVVGLGCPRVGNAAYTHSWHSVVQPIRAVYYSNYLDPIPSVPPIFFGFQHAGMRIHSNKAGVATTKFLPIIKTYVLAAIHLIRRCEKLTLTRYNSIDSYLAVLEKIYDH